MPSRGLVHIWRLAEPKSLYINPSLVETLLSTNLVLARQFQKSQLPSKVKGFDVVEDFRFALYSISHFPKIELQKQIEAQKKKSVAKINLL